MPFEPAPVSIARLGWDSPPPPQVTDALAALHSACESWPRTPIGPQAPIIPGAEDAMCQAVMGRALVLPDPHIDHLANLIASGAVSLAVAVIVLGTAVVAVRCAWIRRLAPPQPPLDQATALLQVLGTLALLTLAARNAGPASIGLPFVFVAAAALWVFLAPSVALLLRKQRTDPGGQDG
jgi:hypothetical protein